MNYLKHYCNLIRKAENRTPPEGYTEKHHVFPVSIYGKNNRIVVLTAREHYIAHALLEKIYIQRYGIGDEKTKKMTYGFWMMRIAQEGKHIRYCNSTLYENLKERWRESISGKNNPFYGKTHSEDTIKFFRESQLGEKSHAYGKKWWNDGCGNTKFSKECPGEGWVLGRGNLTEETRRQMSSSRIGKKWWNDGCGNTKFSKECPGDGWKLGKK